MWDQLILNPMVNALLFLYSLLGGQLWLAIILFTVLIKLITFPLNWQQMKSQQAMQDMQASKDWQDIQKKHAKDKEKLAQAQMKLYKEKGVNPLGSCLPTLIQFPVLIGLYQSITRVLPTAPLQLLDLSNHIYSFFPNVERLIPLNPHFLWMNLGQPERLLIPGLPFGIPTLAILVVVTTFLQQKLITPPTTADPSQQQMTRMMGLYMPLLFGYFVMSYSSALGLYFVLSNVLTIVQYAATGKVDWKNLFSFSTGSPRPAGARPAAARSKK
ncbi:MAG: membrane protein insertase YidC [Chloroflexi bacterium]|nr:membrane protein insertase YidC [Chloroflexota bacterium]